MADDERLSVKEAYAAMFSYLEDLYEREHSDDVGVLLGGMSLLQDGSTADPAAWSDWEAAIRRVRAQRVHVGLGFKPHDPDSEDSS